MHSIESKTVREGDGPLQVKVNVGNAECFVNQHVVHFRPRFRLSEKKKLNHSDAACVCMYACDVCCAALDTHVHSGRGT